MPERPVDREKVRAEVRKLEGADLLVILDRAIDLLPAEKLPGLLEDYAWPDDLRSDGPAPPPDLLATVRRFREASLRGEYREDFAVNSRNFQQKSKGTQRWIAECNRLLDLCIAASDGASHADARTAFELIFDLLVRIDDGGDAIIFFADEAGSWQVGVTWRRVMPGWFRVVAETAGPEEYASAVHGMISYFAFFEADRLVPAAMDVANPEQRAALSRLPPPKRSWDRPSFDV